MKYQMVTINAFKCVGKKTYFIRATQEYMPDVNMGHYKYYILDASGDHLPANILKVQSSCCGTPEGKIDQEFLQKEMKRFLREYKQHQRVLGKTKI